MEITSVRIKIHDGKKENLKAFASITIDNAFAVHGIRIIQGKDSLFISMPSNKAADGKYLDIIHPLSTEVRDEVTKTIVEAYNKKLSELAAAATI